MEKLKCAECIKGYFCGVRNTINIVTFNDEIVIQQLLQMYIVKLYYTYILHPGLGRTETIIIQHLYWPKIRKTVQKEVRKCDVCQCTKRSTKKSELPDKLA